MTKVLNWVQRRVKREQDLAEHSKSLWQEVRSALKASCDSFNEHYCLGVPEVQYDVPDENRVVISRAIADQVTTIVQVEFRAEGRTLEAIRSNPERKLTFALSPNEAEDDAIVSEQKERMSADDFSCRILEDVFFPEGERRQPH